MKKHSSHHPKFETLSVIEETLSVKGVPFHDKCILIFTTKTHFTRINECNQKLLCMQAHAYFVDLLRVCVFESDHPVLMGRTVVNLN